MKQESLITLLHHKDFSSAMQHAYAVAKKRGYTVDKDDIDNKVATGQENLLAKQIVIS